MTYDNHPLKVSFSRDDPVIPVYLFNLIKTLVKERGADPCALVAGVPMSLEELEHQDTLISFNDSMTVIENALRITGEPALGLLVGSRERLSDLGMMGYALSCTKTMEESIKITNKYNEVTTALMDMEIYHEGNRVIHRAMPRFDVSEALNRFLVEEHIGCSVNLIRTWSLPELEPTQVTFKHSAPAYEQMYHDFFRCPVVFDAEENLVILSDEAMHFENPMANEVTERMALKMCGDILAMQRSRRGLISKIQFILLGNKEDFPSAKMVAEELGISERNMRRQLKDLDTSFQEIFDDVRRDLAISYLETTDLPQEEVASLLGFSESSSFYRSFKKWTGRAPTSYRH